MPINLLVRFSSLWCPPEFGFLPVPSWLRYNPEKPFHFGLGMNIAFGLGATFTVSNLYYCQPILGDIAHAFGVDESTVANIPTLIQAGYCAGLLLITPLGDLVQRRQLILLLMLLSGSLTIGLAITKNLIVFEALNFLVGVFTVVPQVLVPLAAELAPPDRKAGAVAIVWSALMMGILIGRVLSGIITNFVTFRAVLLGAYLIIPNYPSANRNGQLTYFKILWTMAKLAVTEPLLIVSSLSLLLSNACFTAFWVTLTFLLLDAPFQYSTLVIGLFGLLGLFGVALGPFVGRAIDKVYPWYAALFSLIALLLFQTVLVIGAGLNLAPIIIAIIGLDLFRQTLQVSLLTGVFLINPSARARLNAVIAVSLFLGQVMGTSAGSEVFLKFGWRACYGLSLAWTGLQVLSLLTRGPHTPHHVWFGYEGGWAFWKSPPTPAAKEESTAQDPVEEKVVSRPESV
ncbi:major facilitator superfamily domain-containing protein [Rhodocollybia butyracea]|uniref:Major facilitator superfamily domain-containing protein n=1 Tax=Rhodocollybia butyracea TaxID=206335 RepID=A0A9P5P6X7_9AGAR|nr:major facilitator superfamily domain-containing protein [Rhodocollybia butyracea]